MATFEESTKTIDVQSLVNKRKRYMLVIIATGIFGGGLYGYSLSFLSGALVTMRFGGQLLSSWDQSVITAVLLLGSAIGSFLGGHLADRFGRHAMIGAGAVSAVVGALVCALVTNILGFSLGRFIVGFAVGITSSVIPTYLGEMAETKHRGRIVSVNSVMINISQLLAAVVNAILAVTANWHAMVWAAVIPGVLLIIVVFFMHETPNFLIRRGLDSQAVRTLLETRPVEEAKNTYDSLVRTREQERSVVDSGKKREGFSTPWLRRVLIAGIGTALINQLVGINVINFFAPTIFVQTLGLDPKNSIISTVPVLAISAIAAIIGGLGLIDRFNRRAMLMTGLGGAIIFLTLVGVCYLFIDPKHPSPVMSWLLILMIMVYLVFAQGLVSPVTWLLIAEIFPSAVRGIGIGYANVAMNIANFLITISFLPLLQLVGGAGAFFTFAAINVISFLFTRFVIPETRGKSLEQIEEEARARVN